MAAKELDLRSQISEEPSKHQGLKSELPLIAIYGETASGKSQLALMIAQEFNGEIIAADSWTVYKDFDIGTAKPTPGERALIKHHMLDIADARDGFNAALYKDMALNAIADIEARTKLPIIVGGTNLYIDSVLYDYSFLPPVPPDERESRNQKSLPDLLEDATAAGIDMTGIDIRNKRRVIRALESGGQRPTNTQIRPNTLLLGIQTDRETLRQRIAERVDNMLELGLEQEVKRLSNKYGWEAEPMKGIGYREWREYFEGSKSLAEIRELIISASMNLAKRQRTWFKRNNSIHWVTDPSKAVDLATTFLSKSK